MNYFVELSDEQIKDIIYCIQGHIIACEEYNQGDEFDINTGPFQRLHEDILNQITKLNGN